MEDTGVYCRSARAVEMTGCKLNGSQLSVRWYLIMTLASLSRLSPGYFTPVSEISSMTDSASVPHIQGLTVDNGRLDTLDFNDVVIHGWRDIETTTYISQTIKISSIPIGHSSLLSISLLVRPQPSPLPQPCLFAPLQKP